MEVQCGETHLQPQQEGAGDTVPGEDHAGHARGGEWGRMGGWECMERRTRGKEGGDSRDHAAHAGGGEREGRGRSGREKNDMGGGICSPWPRPCSTCRRR